MHSVSQKAKEKNYHFLNYFFDRFARIYSTFLPAILLVILIDIINIKINKIETYQYVGAFNIKTFIGNIFMLQEFPFYMAKIHFSVTSFGSARPFWTLAIEWWFYLFFGYIFLWKRTNINIFIKIVITAALSFIPFCNLYFGRGNCLTLVWYLGVLLFFMYFKTQFYLKSIYYYSGFFILLVLIYLRVVANNYDVYDFYVAAILFVLFLSIFKFVDTLKEFVNKNANTIIKKFADFSFSLYLLHYSILDLMSKMQLNINPYILVILSFIICNVISYLFATVTEFQHKKVRTFFKHRINV